MPALFAGNSTAAAAQRTPTTMKLVLKVVKNSAVEQMRPVTTVNRPVRSETHQCWSDERAGQPGDRGNGVHGADRGGVQRRPAPAAR